MAIAADCNGNGAPARLPCSRGSRSGEANISLFDWGGDRRVDVSDPIGVLSFLFPGGPPRVLAVPGRETEECVHIPGCPGAAR